MLPEDAISDVEGWLEDEEILRHSLPHALLAGHASHMRRLSTAVESHDYLVGSSLTLADIAMYGTLLPILSRQPVSCLPGPLSRQRMISCGCPCRDSDAAHATSPGKIASVQEALPPAVRKYLEQLSGLDAVQRGEAQALGKKGVVLQPKQTGHAAPRVPIEGAAHSWQSANPSALPCC